MISIRYKSQHPQRVVMSGVSAHLLLSELPDRGCLRHSRGVRWQCAPTVLLQQIQRPVKEVANIIGQSRIHNLPEALLGEIPILQYCSHRSQHIDT